MSASTRSLWFEPHLLDERAGRRARAACERLGPAVHEAILQAGDHLADVSPVVAQAFYRRAASVWRLLGADGFAAWADLGHDLLLRTRPHREAALAYFGVPARVVARTGLAGMRAWCDAALPVAAVSRRLAGAFFEGTAPLVGTVDAATLEAWVTHGLALYRNGGWRGEFLAHAFFAGARQVLPLLDASTVPLWATLGAALDGRQPGGGRVFGPPPPGFAALKPPDRARLLGLLADVATRDPEGAAAIHVALPAALRGVAPALRPSLLEALHAAALADAGAVAGILPVLPALVRDVPAGSRAAALGHAVAVARAFPQGVVPLLRTLPLAYEDVAPEAVADWVTRGLAIAARNAEAGAAYFALHSRTSSRVLHASSTAAAIGDVQGLLRKYVQMLGGRPASIRTTDALRLRPPLEEFPLENEIALPLRIDVFDTHERNVELYQLLAAHLVGRRLFGTYEVDLPPDSRGGLVAYLRDPAHPEHLEELFLLAEGFRVAAALARHYAGLAAAQRALMGEIVDRCGPRPPSAAAAVLDACLAALLAGRPLAALPAWLRHTATIVAPCVAPLASDTATARDALQVAHLLATRLAGSGTRPAAAAEFDELALDRVIAEGLLDYSEGAAAPAPGGGDTPAPDTAAPPPPSDAAVPALELEPERDGRPGTTPISPELLQRLIEAGVDLRLGQGHGENIEGLGLYITDLLGKLPDEQIDALRRLLGDAPRPDRPAPRRWIERQEGGASFYYDEWDYQIGDYRPRWCRLREVPLEGDAGEFFTGALARHAALIPEIRRQFQRIRPEMYRIVRGLEDGDDFDLNAVVDARVDRRARRAPSPKLYVARTREERDVATLFLIDMSASTDEPLDRSAGSRAGGRRIIDVTKEALVLMAEALEEIGDAYAIYGFSGHGRQQVEFYLVKAFNETLSAAVRGRIGGIEPKRSTRMGTAIRHAAEKLAAITARSRHIILLSDGFPQDFDYGQDRRSNVYGIRDTAVALRECEQAGIVPFCITVDKAGHDYLREMCAASRYLVIEDIAALPRELPKIYQRVVGPAR